MPAVVSEVCDLGYGEEVKCSIKLILSVFLCARVWCSFEKMKEDTSKLFLFPRVLACVS